MIETKHRVVCEKCGVVSELNSDYMDACRKAMAEGWTFSDDKEHCDPYGYPATVTLCPQCSRKDSR